MNRVRYLSAKIVNISVRKILSKVANGKEQSTADLFQLHLFLEVIRFKSHLCPGLLNLVALK